MKKPQPRRKPSGPKDYLALSLTTFGVGYFPIAPGTIGSGVGVLIYILVARFEASQIEGLRNVFTADGVAAVWAAVNAVLLLIFTIAGIAAAGRSIDLLGDADPSEAVIDEVIGQLVTFAFIPFAISWQFILAGFLLFRLFDIWKPFPIDLLQSLPGGVGICADDILAGIYAGICLALIYAGTLLF